MKGQSSYYLQLLTFVCHDNCWTFIKTKMATVVKIFLMRK